MLGQPECCSTWKETAVRVLVDDRVMEGTPLQIVQQMASLEFATNVPVRMYVEGVLRRLEAYGRPLSGVQGDSDVELASSFIKEALRVGMLGKL
jgi:hypothetical protein